MNLRLSISGIIISIASLFVFIPVLVSAQGIPSTIGGIELTASTNNPLPEQNVTITAKNYSLDINSATITWSAGGKTIAKGLGVTSVTIQAPILGKQLEVIVSAVMPDGTSFINSITINSSSVDMIIESGGYVPPMFMGRISVGYQNPVKITAIPHLANSKGIEYDPQTLIYKWEQSSNVLQSQSGYGKQSVKIQSGIIPRPSPVTVTVTTRDGLLQARGQVTVTPVSPFALFYRNDPLYGIMYNLAVGNTVYLGSQREIGVIIAPYGFNAPMTGKGDLSLSWYINGTEHPELSSNKSVTLRAPSNTAGSSNVQIDITHSKDILERASARFSAVFNATASSSFSSGI